MIQRFMPLFNCFRKGKPMMERQMNLSMMQQLLKWKLASMVCRLGFYTLQCLHLIMVWKYSADIGFFSRILHAQTGFDILISYCVLRLRYEKEYVLT